jgi:hypothetical protein
MMEMDDVIAVIGSHAVVESDLANLLPVFDDDPLERGEPFGAATVGSKDVEAEATFRSGIAAVEGMRVDFVPDVRQARIPDRPGLW